MSENHEAQSGIPESMIDAEAVLTSEPVMDSSESFAESAEHEITDSSEQLFTEEEVDKPRLPRDADRFKEISGADSSGRTKCEIFFRHYLQYSDGTTKEVEELHIRKPVINIFSAGGYVNVFLNFFRRTDEDLRMAWNLVTNYMNPANSAVFLPEEIEQGYYVSAEGNEELVYYPFLELAISPLGHEKEYMIHGYRPLLYCLVGESPEKDLTIMQLVFKDNLFIVNKEIGAIDRMAVQQEAIYEAQMEMAGELPELLYDES